MLVFATTTLATTLAYSPAVADSDHRCPAHATMELAYDVVKSGVAIPNVSASDGSVMTYQTSAPGPNRYLIKCKVTDASGHLVSNGSYLYTTKPATLPDSDPILVRLESVVDGQRVAANFDDRGRRILYADSDGSTRFAYDDEGRITLRATHEETTRYTYDKATGKVTSVATDAGAEHSRSTYSYDTGGNLVHATSSGAPGSHDIRLTYDPKGRIVTLADGGSTLAFTYNDQGKPTVIELKGTGTITVTYDDAGQIKNVDSSAGRVIALKVTALFQTLLDVIRPAGADIKF